MNWWQPLKTEMASYRQVKNVASMACLTSRLEKKVSRMLELIVIGATLSINLYLCHSYVPQQRQ